MNKPYLAVIWNKQTNLPDILIAFTSEKECDDIITKMKSTQPQESIQEGDEVCKGKRMEIITGGGIIGPGQTLVPLRDFYRDEIYLTSGTILFIEPVD